MKRLACLAFTLLSVLYGHSQPFGSIRGAVYDLTGKPLLGANVYLANTTIGMSVGDDGLFALNRIPLGKYDLIASMVGYKASSQTVTIDSTVEIKIFLQPEIKALQEITIKARPKAPKNEYFKFEKIFLGSTQNAAHCKITNRQVVDASESNGLLTAVAYKPIEIVNEALGYRIIYDLRKFAYSSANTVALIEGPFRFENLEPRNKRQEKKWKKERDRAYYGSIVHFIQALKNRNLSNSGFKLLDLHGVEFPWEKLFVDDLGTVIKYKGKLVLVYDRELAEPGYDPQRRSQESILNFSGNPVRLYENGVYHRFQDLVLEGYLAWTSRIADLIPLAYKPDRIK